MKFDTIKSFAKINLSLGITGKLNSGYHKIESLISFLDLSDDIKIRNIKNKNHKVYFYGKFSKGIKKKNTVSSLLKILDQENLLNKKKYLIKINKKIPQMSGLGGGSMNASTIIRYFKNKKIINITKKNIFKIAKQIGSDVKLGLDNKNKVLYSNGKLETKSKKKRLFVIIVKPNFGCSTKEIYKGVKKYSPKKLIKNKKNYFNLVNITKLQNDLEGVVFKIYPKLFHVKSFMESMPNVELVRMTGSGSSILGYFLSKNSAKNAAKLFKKKYKNYWCIVSKTI